MIIKYLFVVLGLFVFNSSEARPRMVLNQQCYDSCIKSLLDYDLDLQELSNLQDYCRQQCTIVDGTGGIAPTARQLQEKFPNLKKKKR